MSLGTTFVRLTQLKMLRHFCTLFTLMFLLGNAYAQEISSTTAISSACGVAGYFACPVDLGPGCCPTGFICGGDQVCLTASAIDLTTASSLTCIGRHGYHSCPQSQGGDCCPNGYMCATATDAPCRLTLRLDFVTETITSTVGSMVSVWTTTSAIDPPSTAADRVPEISSSDSSLTASQIGGIIGGVLGAVLAIITVVVLLIRRRRKELLAAGHSERVFQKGELDGQGWQRAELQEMASGNHIVPAELAGGHSQHELVGSYEAHGTSELHGSRPYYSPLGTNT